jgi:Fic family protein
MKPPFNITSQIVNLCTDISRIVGQCEGLTLSPLAPQLRRHNRIRTIQSSLAIEGNILSESQVTDILENKRVIGPAKDILEVKNAVKAYDLMKTYDIYSLKSFLSAHKILMQGLIEDAGKIRSRNVGVVKGKEVVHMAPKYTMVPKLLDSLFYFLKQEKETHSFIKSSIFHYELEFIHPFSDGNGRIGRLWQSAILLNAYPIFEFVPVESMVKIKQKEYYRALALSDKKGNSTPFIEFMLKTILQCLEEFIKDIRLSPQNSQTRLSFAQEHFSKSFFSRKDYMLLHKTISSATASRDLSFGVKNKLLKKSGQKALTMYQFI